MSAIAKFRLGRIVTTTNAKAVIPDEEMIAAIGRHQAGDWGDLCEEDRLANEQSLKEALRLLSVYQSARGVRFYVITEANRSFTTILLPEEY